MKEILSGKYTVRQAGLEDIEKIHRVEEKKSLHYHGVSGFSLERLINEYQVPGFDIKKCIHLVEDQDGKLVAHVEVWDETNPPVLPCALPSRPRGWPRPRRRWTPCRFPSTTRSQCPRVRHIPTAPRWGAPGQADATRSRIPSNRLARPGSTAGSDESGPQRAARPSNSTLERMRWGWRP